MVNLTKFFKNILYKYFIPAYLSFKYHMIITKTAMTQILCFANCNSLMMEHSGWRFMSFLHCLQFTVILSCIILYTINLIFMVCLLNYYCFIHLLFLFMQTLFILFSSVIKLWPFEDEANITKCLTLQSEVCS